MIARTGPPTLTRPSAIALALAMQLPLNSNADGAVPIPTDAYLDEYGTLYDHIGMLHDHERMASYHDAIKIHGAAQHFAGKVVLDVGAGSGVLSVWAAQAGARKVYAVEGTSVARHAERLVKAHNLENVVTVLRGRMEEVELPEKVDVIVSEWMGYFLLRETMVTSVLHARDKWLQPNGVLYPSSVRLLLGELRDAEFVAAREAETVDAMESWDELTGELEQRYDLRFGALREPMEVEHEEYAYRQAWQGGVPSAAVVGEPAVLLELDMHTATADDLFGWQRDVTLGGGSSAGPLHGLCGWFDVAFCGRADAPAAECTSLDTSPHAPRTHWGQTALLFKPQPSARPVALRVGLEKSRESHHDLNFTVAYREGGEDVTASYSITNDFRGYTADERAKDEL